MVISHLGLNSSILQHNSQLFVHLDLQHLTLTWLCYKSRIDRHQGFWIPALYPFRVCMRDTNLNASQCVPDTFGYNFPLNMTLTGSLSLSSS